MKTIEIQPDNARKAYQQAQSGASLPDVLSTLLGEQTVVDSRPVTERIKTWEDVLTSHGTTQDAFNANCSAGDLTSDEIGYRMCKMWVAALNEGWAPDYSNPNEPKHHVWMEYNNGSGFRFHYSDYNYLRSTVGSRLVLKSSELAQHYGTYAVTIINQFFL